MRQWITDYVARVAELPASEITPETVLETCGLDSVDSVLITGALEERFGIEIDPTLFMRSRNIDEVIADLRRSRLLN